MLHFDLRSKLIIAFLIVLLPLLGLIIYDYTVDYRQWSEQIVEDQLRTGEAIAALADASIDDALSVAWSFSTDPVVRTMDSSQIDPYLESQTAYFPQFDTIAVFDAKGDTVGSMALRAQPGVPRPNISDRAYFHAVMSTGKPFVDSIVISRASGKPVAVVAVPMFDGSRTVQGVTITTLNLDYLARRVATVGLRQSQAIFMTDPQGTVAFHTGLGQAEWGRRDLSDYDPVRAAMRGLAARELGIPSPQGDIRTVAATRTAKYGWIVGVSVPRDEVLQPIRADLARQLAVFAGVMSFASFVAVLASQRLILHPLGVLMDHIKAFGRGQFCRRIDLRTGDEMELAANTFNQMAAQLQQWSQEREGLLQETLTAHTELEEARQRREQFISMVAHDFRNPIAVIVGYGEMVADAVKLGKVVDPRVVNKIIGQAVRLRRLVEDLSDVSLIEAGRFKLLKTTSDLSRAARDVVEQQQMMTVRHTIILDPLSGPVVGNWDCDRLAQALNNLVSNAIKYSPSGGEIRVGLSVSNGEVTVSVGDEGVGIAPEDVSQLFQPYARLDQERPIRGTGLGLYITKTIILAHGGRFWVQSEEDRGSTFAFAIPVNGAG